MCTFTRINRLIAVFAVCFSVFSCSSYRSDSIKSNQNESVKPNILFVFTDDQAPWALGHSGDTQAVTPNLDRLATEGMYLPNAYAVTPVCSPSRASVMTSRYGFELGIDDWINVNPKAKTLTGHQYGVGLDEAYETWPEALQKAGYATSLIGKWHIGKDEKHHPTHHGYGEFKGFLKGGATPINPTLEIDGIETKHQGLTVDILTDYAIEFMTNQGTQPFALSLHYRAPHYKFLPVAPEDSAPFENMDIQLPHPDYPGLNTERGTKLMREYLSSVHGIDRNMGRLMQALERLGLDQNTVVIFSSDHGYSIGHNGTWHKGNGFWLLKQPPEATATIPKGQRPNLYDNNIKVPLIVRWPGVVTPGSVNASTLSSLDWFPTLASIAGADIGEDTLIRGKDFVPAFKDESHIVSDDYYAVYSTLHQSLTHMRMYSDGDYKLVLDFKNKGRDEFYDLLNDPEETQNLLLSDLTPQQQRKVKQFKQVILAKMKETRDPVITQ